MSEVTHLIYAPGDNLKKFNRQIRQACSEVPVTRFEACLIKGGGVKVSLFTDYVEADGADAAEDSSGEIKVGDTILDGLPSCAFLAVTNVENLEQKKLTEERLDKLADLCQSSVTEEIDLIGQDYAWVVPPAGDGQPNSEAKPVYLPVTVSYTLIVFEILARAEEDEGDDGDTDPSKPKPEDFNDLVGDEEDEASLPTTSKGGKKKATKKKAAKSKKNEKGDDKNDG